MKFAHILGWVNTRIILTLVYFLVFTPVALIFKLIGKDPMNRRFETADVANMEVERLRGCEVENSQLPIFSTSHLPASSYWIKREAKVFAQEDYRRQF